MWVITYKGKPAPLVKLHEATMKDMGHPPFYIDSIEEGAYLTGTSRRVTVDVFLHYFGFTWAERAKGIDVKKFN